MTQGSQSLGQWALILGASSGFGAASALALARTGRDILGVHLDTRATLPKAHAVRDQIRALGRQALFVNANAADAKKRGEILDQLAQALRSADPPATVGVLLHSLAFGTLKPYIGSDAALTQAQMEMTLDVMAHSLVYWTQDVVHRGLMGPGGRVLAMTSAGALHAIPFYGAVSAAKAALEAHVRQLAVELAPRGITVNAIRAGVTDTPALRRIPGYERLMEEARRRNPHGRLTTPEDVARAIVVLASPQTSWITGNVIGVDGGEEISG